VNFIPEVEDETDEELFKRVGIDNIENVHSISHSNINRKDKDKRETLLNEIWIKMSQGKY